MNNKLTTCTLLFVAGVLHLSTLVSGTAITALGVRKSEERCEFPGNELLRSKGFEQLFKLEDGFLVPIVSAESIIEWKRCAEGQVDKAWAEKTLRLLKRSFMKMEGGKEILKLSSCRRSEVLELFDADATSVQAEKAGSCLVNVFKEQDGSQVDNLNGVVRIDEDCEREKRNQIQEAEAKVLARLAALAAAGVYCAAAPFSFGLAVAWCTVFAALTADTLLAEAELYAAQRMECPTCSDEPTF